MTTILTTPSYCNVTPAMCGRTPQSDLIVGIAMIILSVACAAAYSVILVAIWKDKEMISLPSYKFMFVLGLCDVAQCFPHAVTGIFTIYQSTGPWWLNKLMGVCISPFYQGYSILTVMLSVNRFVVIALASTRWEQTMFSPNATKVWIGVACGVMLVYIIALASPWATMRYIPELYSWAWDDSRVASFPLRKIAMVIQLGSIFASGVLYIGVVIMLIRTRKRFSSSRNYTTEVKILIQALTITVYCSILNTLWHNYQLFLPEDLWTYLALNIMWILNSGIYPIIYFIVNSAIRGKIVKATKVTRSTFMNSGVLNSGAGSHSDATKDNVKTYRTSATRVEQL